MRKIISTVLIAILMGSLSANAVLIFSDGFSVAGGAGAINDGIGVTRQTTGSTTSTYTHGGAGNVSIVDDFGNGGTAKMAGTYNNSTSSQLFLDSSFGSELSGTDWNFNFTAYSPITSGSFNDGWFGFGLGTSTYPSGAPSGEFGMLTRPTGEVTIFQNGGGSIFSAGTVTWNSFSSVIRYHMLVDEINNQLTVGYDAFDPSNLAYLGSEIIVTTPTTLDAGDRILNWAINADDASNATISTYIEDVKIEIEVIPEPATFGLFALMGGGLLFIRRNFKK